MNTQLLHNELTSLSIPISGCDSSGNVQLLVSRNKVIQIDNGDGTFGSQTLDEDSDEYIRANQIVALALAAHEQPLSSEPAQALKAELTELEWQAYCECRNQPVKAARAVKYKEITDALFMSTFENATKTKSGETYTLKVPVSSFDEWTTAKQNIRDSLPYSTEE